MSAILTSGQVQIFSMNRFSQKLRLAPFYRGLCVINAAGNAC